MGVTASASRPGSRRRLTTVAVALLALVALVAGTAPASAGGGGDHRHGGHGRGKGHGIERACERRNNNSARKLLECLTAKGALRHLQAFQAIADANGGTRASGTPGYDASVDYVVAELRQAGYDPEVQAFQFPFYDDTSTVTLGGEPLSEFSATGEGDYWVMTYSGSGAVTSSAIVPTTDVVVPIGDSPENTSTSGCEPEDFPAPPADPAIALVQRGECPFAQKAQNAQDLGYDAVVVFNEGQPGRDDVVLGTLGPESVGVITIPVIGVSYEQGVQLIEAPEELSIQVEVVTEERETYNVTADLPGRNADNVVVVGGHLDSVTEGPGINDNGSGSAAVLETALKMANNKPANTVRFAWWGAEEGGLIGSWEYVESLPEEELARIALYLNFDMVASPNFVRFVYDGDQSTFPAPVEVPAGSPEIEAVFREFFDGRGLAAEDTEFSGRSDYEAFILNGIPAGGLFTGAEVAKTEEQVAVYGGVAGLSYDPCYHQACDDLEPPNAFAELQAAYGRALLGNVNLLALDQNLDAIGYATLRFSQSTEDVNGVPGRPGRGPKVAADTGPGADARGRGHARDVRAS